ncbi:MAG: DUF2334 domain-containing protein [Chloroflexi bacterium AL-W]|nr:DUF2334 domain-containing protein [Chloroflexi bacterium AL-N1]NOK71170.1 DUF2334 domain-containing protein [Chloroflexi bacterium AL-N10]NOK78636.1 DUF2334 domain-containing protein [Chloroflexi bacterium AL-N5]NOK85932.1 DUF2334 domain-containing protein [Chloroflexi bacterium AL-W]NOK92907.1 DUF2334 domain-containing protein [Chloroflexi bacterium AL-N15]
MCGIICGIILHIDPNSLVDVSIMPYFTVVVHDVAAPLLHSIQYMLHTLQPFVGNTINAAVVPCWHGNSTHHVTAMLVHLVNAYCGDVLLHGFTHLSVQTYHPLTWLTECANEFSGLDHVTAADRLGQGQQWMYEWFGKPARGFVPPAWQFGSLTPPILRAYGFHYWMGYTCLEFRERTRYPLATWSWDAGRIAVLGLVGDLVGHVHYRLSQRRLPCIVFHPNDVVRGYFARGLQLIERLLLAGYQPILVRDIEKIRGTT